MRGAITLLGCSLLLLACGLETEPIDEDAAEELEFYGDGKADFSWGSGSAAGESSFSLDFQKNKIITLGTVPVGKKDVLIKVDSSVNIDLQLLDTLSNTKVVYKSWGKLSGASKATLSYQGLTVEWSGYNGTSAGKGHEYIKLTGTTTVPLKVRIYTPAAGSATVGCQWASTGTAPASGFAQRLQAFQQKYGEAVVVASKKSKPAIFLSTAGATDETSAGELIADLYTMIGTHTVMLWNPAGENFFHLALPDNPKLDPRYRKKSFTVYSHFRIWDNTLGNFDEHGYDDEEELGDHTYYYPTPSHDESQLGLERAVALIVLTEAQFVELNTYLDAIVDDFPATLGKAEFNGGTPPYFTGDPEDEHNCTTWFTAFLSYKVNSGFSLHANPAAMMRDYTGSYGAVQPEYRGLLVFNYGGTLPAAGASLPSSFPLDFGH